MVAQIQIYSFVLINTKLKSILYSQIKSSFSILKDSFSKINYLYQKKKLKFQIFAL